MCICLEISCSAEARRLWFDMWYTSSKIWSLFLGHSLASVLRPQTQRGPFEYISPYFQPEWPAFALAFLKKLFPSHITFSCLRPSSFDSKWDRTIARVRRVSTEEDSYLMSAFEYFVKISAVIIVRTIRLFPSALGYIPHLFSNLEFWFLGVKNRGVQNRWVSGSRHQSCAKRISYLSILKLRSRVYTLSEHNQICCSQSEKQKRL
jgi:hypothetical protein